MALVAAALSFGAAIALLGLLPRPWGSQNMLPWGLATWVGVLAALFVDRARDGGRRLRFTLAAAAVYLVTVVASIQLAAPKDAFNRSYFGAWIPLVAGSGLVVWLGGALLEWKLRRRVAWITAILLGLGLGATTLQNGSYLHKSLRGDRVRAWNVFHYYVGSKYFPELSYYDLYAATLLADDDWQGHKKAQDKKTARKLKKVKDFRKIRKARDMHSYITRPRAELVADFDRSQISEQRLQELGRDTRFLRRYMGYGRPGWVQAFSDLGYNPAPAWTVVGVPLANLVPARWPWFWIIANSDVPLYLLAIFLSGWAFGLRGTAAALLWLNTMHINEARFTGGMLQYDWCVSVVAAWALYRKGWYRASGLALVWGAMTRVFPGFLIFGLVPTLLRDLRRGPPPGVATGTGLFARFRRRHVRFLGAFTAGCLALAVASNFTGGGLDTWPNWVDKITRHSGTHAVTSNQRIGVGRLAVHKPNKKNFWGEVRKKRRPDTIEAVKPRKRQLQLLGLVLLLPALLRRRDQDGMALMSFFVFLAVVLSRYYASTWAILFFLGAAGTARAGPGEDPDEVPGRGDTEVPGLASWTGVFAGSVLLALAAGFDSFPGSTAGYFIVNWAVYGMFAVLCVALVGQDLWRWRQERAAGPGGAAPAVDASPADDPWLDAAPGDSGPPDARP